jgi:D-alanyl-lipoteichoic acid acyltransferase DltB (MBOAT superfamily)
MGIELIENFRFPYLVRTPQEFWRHWHISLSTWLRDYLYIPLGGNRGTRWQTNRNLMVTMMLGGLWHGAAWTFVLWGVYQGVLLIGYRAFDQTRWFQRMPRFLAWLIMFHLTCIGWLIFRAPSLRQLGTLTQNLFLHFAPATVDVAGLLVPLLLFTVPLLLIHLWEARADDLLLVPRLPLGLRYSVVVATMYLILLFGNFGGAEFIYFQF